MTNLIIMYQKDPVLFFSLIIAITCFIAWGILSWRDSEQEAISAWNRRADRWISVSERLPENPNNWVLVYADEAMNCMMYDEVNNKFYDPTYSKCHNICIEDVTHWMPLPEPPEGVDQK